MTIKEIRQKTGLSQSRFAAKYGIPVKTIQNWEIDKRSAPEYVVDMLNKIVEMDKIETKAWVFEECRDKAGIGHYELFKDKAEAIEYAQKEWGHKSQRDKESYHPEDGDWFLVAEVPVEWDEYEESFEPVLEDLDPVWSAF